MNRNWSVELVSIFREQNSVADILAKMAAKGSEAWMVMTEPPDICRGALLDDQLGIPISRVTSLNGLPPLPHPKKIN